MTIKVTNNPDGTFTVESGNETVIVGTPKPAPKPGSSSNDLPPISGAGGVGTAQIINSRNPPSEARPAESAEKLLAMLRSEPLSFARGGHAATSRRAVHYKMEGTHTLDVGEIADVAARRGVAVHIHLVHGDG